MSNKWNLIVDVARCTNCNNCALATKDELIGNEFPGYSAPHAAHGPGVMRLRRHVRGATPMVDVTYVPQMCNHCDDAPCIKAAGDGSIRKREDGIVVIDPVKAKGRRDLVGACPYGAIVWNEQQQLPQNWFFDAHLLDAGASAPRCVGVCPTEAIEAVKTDDAAMATRAEREELRVLQPELRTRPRVWYRNLDRIDHCFIGGSVTRVSDGVPECVEGATVELYQKDVLIASSTTDTFGDFRFDGLLPGSGDYEVRAVHGTAKRTVPVVLQDQSVVMAEIVLRAAKAKAASEPRAVVDA
ncbi:MAG: carboxypeptidase regulatory-like domain-containing protein [Gammaproteobacteria bacterium]|nr:carboxypeptidase regulatory-like domain-containing protein [Gammaproteobacteria bacterium]